MGAASAHTDTQSRGRPHWRGVPRGADTGLLDEIDRRGAYTKEKKAPLFNDAPAPLRHNHTAPLAISTGHRGDQRCMPEPASSWRPMRTFAGPNPHGSVPRSPLGLPAEYGSAGCSPASPGAPTRRPALRSDPRSAHEVERLGFVQRALPTMSCSPALGSPGTSRHSSADSLRTMKRASGSTRSAISTSLPPLGCRHGGCAPRRLRHRHRGRESKTRPDFLSGA